MRSFIILLTFAAAANADHCRQSHRFIETPVYGVLPAPIVFYSIGGTYQVAPAIEQTQAAPVDEKAKLIAEIIAILEARKTAPAAVPVTLIGQKCASCHGPAATNNLARDGLKLESMTADDRLNAIEALRSDRMPPNAKKQPLDGVTASKLIGELTQRPEKQSLPAPPPEPKKE